MKKTVNTTYAQTTTDNLKADLRIKFDLIFNRYPNSDYLWNCVEQITNELHARGFSWDEIEAMSF